MIILLIFESISINDCIVLDRDVLVLKNIGWKEETLKLEVWAEDLSPAQLELRSKSKNEIDDINTRLDKLLKETTSEVIFEGDNTALYEFERELKEKPSAFVL